MITYFLTIDHVLSSDPQVFARVIPTMERAQGLLCTLEIISDCQSLPTLSVLAIIELINVVHLGTVSKCNNIKIELIMKEKYCRPINTAHTLLFRPSTQWRWLLFRSRATVPIEIILLFWGIFQLSLICVFPFFYGRYRSWFWFDHDISYEFRIVLMYIF
jgi:hypothetical protein